MAKKKGKTFGDRLARQLKVSMGAWWSDEGIQAINEIARQGGVDCDEAEFGSLALTPVLTFQHEMAVRDFDEQGKEFDDLSPFVYPELMRSWEHNSTCVEFSEGATAVAFDSEPGFIQSVPLAGLYDFFPGCMALDVRKLNVVLYNIAVDEVFVYPSYNAVNGHVALMFVGVSQNLGFTFAYEARLVLQGETFGDAARATNHVLEEERSACLGGLSTAPSEEFFSALDSEPELFAVTWRLLAALCSDRVELVRQSWGRGESVKARPRKPESQQVVEGVRVGEGKADTVSVAGDLPATQGEHTGGAPSEACSECEGSHGEHAEGDTRPQAPEQQEGLKQPVGSEAVDGATVADGTERTDAAGTSPEAQEQEASSDASEDALKIELLQEEVDRLRAELDEREAADSFRVRQLEDEARELRDRAQSLQVRAHLVETMKLPETPYEALALAERAFPDRIIVLDRARKSASEFVKGDPGEVWAVLRSVAVTLYSLLFEERERGLANAFRDRTGYELALRDSKGANRNPEQKAERMVDYEGEVRDATMHIKGRGTRRGESLRVHFFVDYTKKRIVIAHCGEHLTTDRTSSM